MASGRAFDRADERSRQHGLPGLDASAVSGQAIDEPRYRTGRIAQPARTEAGLLDCAVARHDRTDPPHVGRAEIHDRIADADARIGGIVRDRVEHGPQAYGPGIIAPDATAEKHTP